MKLILGLVLSTISFVAVSAEPLLSKLDRLNIKAHTCVVSGTMDVDSKWVNFRSSLYIFAADENEALKSCVNQIRLIQLGERADESVSFMASLEGETKKVRVTNVEIIAIND